MNPLSTRLQAGLPLPARPSGPDETNIQTLLDQARHTLEIDDRPFDAAKRFESVLLRDPDNLEAMIGAGQAWLKANHYSLAHFHFKTALQSQPTSAKALVGLAFTRQKSEGQQAALMFLIDHAPPAILAFANDPSRMMAQLQSITDPLTDGLEDVMLDIAEAIEPTFLQVARQFQERHQHAEALAMHEILIEHGSETLDTWLARSDTLLALGRIADAAESYRQSLETCQPDLQIGVALHAGQGLLQASQANYAIEFFNWVLDNITDESPSSRQNLEARIGLGFGLIQLGNQEQAHRHFLAVLHAAPNEPRALLGVGLIELPTNPTRAISLLFNAGVLFMKRNNYRSARTALAIAQHKAPEQPAIAITLGAVCLGLKQAPEAIGYLEAFSEDPTFGPLAKHWLGRCHLAEGRVGEAIQYFSESTTCPRMRGHSSRFLGRIFSTLAAQKRSSPADRRQAVEAALFHWRRTLTEQRDSEEAKLGVARALHQLKSNDPALKGARDILQSNPDSTEAIQLLASIQLDQGTLSTATLEKLTARWDDCQETAIEAIIALAQESMAEKSSRKRKFPEA